MRIAASGTSNARSLTHDAKSQSPKIIVMNPTNPAKRVTPLNKPWFRSHLSAIYLKESPIHRRLVALFLSLKQGRQTSKTLRIVNEIPILASPTRGHSDKLNRCN